MIEWALLFALGFFSACMIGVLALPMIWNRAMKVSQRRIEATIPVTVAEMAADKDQLRAEFAMSMSRLEDNLEKLKEKASTRLVEVGKRDEAIQALRSQLLAQKRASGDLRDEIEDHKKTVRRLETDLEAANLSARQSRGKTAVAGAAAASLAAQGGETVDETAAGDDAAKAELDRYMALADSRRIEIAALKTQLENVKGEFADLKLAGIDAAPASSGDDDKAAGTRAKADAEAIRAAAREATDLKTALSEAEAKIDTLEAAARDAEAERIGAVAETRALKAEIAALKATRDADWDIERQENALMRERLNDLAAEVAKVAFALEDDDELRDLARKTADAADADDARGAAPSPLADRIRVLQARLSESA